MAKRHQATAVAARDDPDEIKLPASLVELANQEHLSFAHTLLLLKMRQQIKAHRRNEDPEQFDWKAFYEAVKEFLNDTSQS